MTKLFKIGDVVTLKSGGIKMTVSENLAGDSLVYTLWFDKDGALCRDAFHQDELEMGV